jgi:putative membrane protein
MLWILSFHIIFIICWFAGLFYLPRLFVYHSMAVDVVSIDRFKVMEKKLFFAIMIPSGVLATLFGFWLLWLNFGAYWQRWMWIKLVLVLILWAYHFYCGWLVKLFKEDHNVFSHRFYRWFNEIPSVLLVATVILAVVKPF